MVISNSPSFNHYGKVSENPEDGVPGARCLPLTSPSSFPEQTGGVAKKRRVIIIGLLVALLVVVVCVAIAVPVTMNKNKDKKDTSPDAALVTLCQSTMYPQVCQESLNNSGSDPQQLVNKAVRLALSSTTQLSLAVTTLVGDEIAYGNDSNVLAALADCKDLLDDAYENINTTLDSISTLGIADLQALFDDLSTYMSTALTDKTTCLDGFEELANSTTKSNLTATAQQTEEFISIALTLVTGLTSLGSDLANWQSALSTPRGLTERHLLEGNEDDYPKWFGVDSRRLLASSGTFPVDVTVAQDGSGDYSKIQKAVDNAPKKSKKRYVIHIKAGVYKEQVTVPKSNPYVMFLGDGAGKTILTGSLSVAMEGVTTFKSATLIIQGANFIGRGFSVRNTAGAVNHQAVALRVSADRVAFWQVSLEGYQDTLYAHSQRQFYKDSTIVGTVDFIFGNGAVVFQTCNIQIRVPMVGQQCTVSAQGRTDPSQNTGLVFYNCNIDGVAQLRQQAGTVLTYLGRPWKLYSRTIFIRSYLGSVINPAGWLIWVGDWALKTCYYAEFQNSGPGSPTRQRVSWSRQLTSARSANKFSIPVFIGGNKWLSATRIPYDSTTF